MCEIEREIENNRDREREIFGEIERKQGLIELGNLVGERKKERSEKERERERMAAK